MSEVLLKPKKYLELCKILNYLFVKKHLWNFFWWEQIDEKDTFIYFDSLFKKNLWHFWFQLFLGRGKVRCRSKKWGGGGGR